MKNMPFPQTGISVVNENQENRNARVLSFAQADAAAFDAYCAQLSAEGYVEKEAYTQGMHRFAAFQLDDCGIFVNYYGSAHELRVVAEGNCTYFHHSDRPGKASVSAQITQLALENFGMSYVIRLSDGRFILIDGGNNIEADCRKLYDCLKAQSPFEKPVIASWILSHPHSDHFNCFLGFMEAYAQEVVIESFLFNFPECDDYVHYPALADESFYTVKALPAVVTVPKMLDWVAKSGAAVYTPHTGQRYSIGDANLEILSSMDDTIHLSQNINCISLVIRMTLGGQVILWTSDADFNSAQLAQRYGSWLKADILQIPHHGLQCGTAEAELEGYAMIQPRVCLLPADDFTAFTFFCAYRPGTRSLMLSDKVEELITGSTERTLILPYEPPAGAMEKIRKQMREGETHAGARVWFFTGLSTANPEDYVFTLLNTVIPTASVRIDLYFEEKARAVRDVRTEVTGSCFRQINLLSDDVDGNYPSFSTVTLQRRGFPENQPFAVRFLSDIPIVVSHKKHAAAYHSIG